MGFFIDGTSIPKQVKRVNPKIAEDVMIHIGGYYTKGKGTIHKIGGTYGCYGIVDSSMVFGTWKEANTWASKAKPVVKDTNR